MSNAKAVLLNIIRQNPREPVRPREIAWSEWEGPRKCTCAEGGGVEDRCPFAAEIHDEEKLCSCCDYCRYQCAMDI